MMLYFLQVWYVPKKNFSFFGTDSKISSGGADGMDKDKKSLCAISTEERQGFEDFNAVMSDLNQEMIRAPFDN